jgi:hypothetical protein
MKIIYFFLLLLLPITSFSQSNESSPIPDERLVEAYGADYINRLVEDNPFLIKRWNFYLDNAYFITDNVPEKEADYKVIQIENLEQINILTIEKEQKLERAWDVPTIYKIDNSNKLLVFYSGKVFTEKFKAHLDSK